MSKHDKLLEKILGGQHDANIRFDELCALLQKHGYRMRQGRGSHVTFIKDAKFLNLQNRNGKVAGYQVRQAREQLRTE